MTEVRNLGKDYLLRNLQNYEEFRCCSKYPFSLALMTLQAICVVLCDVKYLSDQIEKKDESKKLKDFTFFKLENNPNASYQECFKNLRNSSSHMMENYTPQNSEIGCFSKVFYTNSDLRSTCLNDPQKCLDIKNCRKKQNECLQICPNDWKHCKKEITSTTLKKFLLLIRELLTDNPSKKISIKRKAIRRKFKKFMKNY